MGRLRMYVWPACGTPPRSTRANFVITYVFGAVSMSGVCVGTFVLSV